MPNILLDTVIGEETFFEIAFLLRALIIGLFIGFAGSAYSKLYLGRIVRALLKSNAVGKENAIPFQKTGVRPSFLIKLALRSSSALSKYVVVSNPDDCAFVKTVSKFEKALRKILSMSDKPSAYYDLKKACIYIPEDKKYAADVKYESKSNPIVIIIVGVLAFVFLWLLSYWGMPYIKNIVNSILQSYKNI